jgi:tRNA nucleotidyltransferase (CCA-adding enzyme)
MIGCEQEFELHPEGDVWVHTLLVVDGAKEIVDMNALKGDTARVVMLAALCHDLGKPKTTEFKEGRIRSHAHDVKGVESSAKFLERIGTRKKDIEKVINLVREHIWPTVNYLHQNDDSKNKGNIKDGAFRRLAKRLHPATIEELSYIVEADCKGVGPFLDPQNPRQFLLKTVEAYGYDAGRWLRQRAEEVGVYRELPKPFVAGKELIELGYKPSTKEGERFNDVIRLADECRDLAGMSKKQLIDILKDGRGSIKDAVLSLSLYLDKHVNPFRE